MSVWTKRRPGLVVAAMAVSALFALAACSDNASHAPSGGAVVVKPKPKPITPAPAQPATLTASVKSAATDVPVDTPVSVTASGGTLTAVRFSGGGTTLSGSFNTDKTTWTANGFLDPAVHYTLQSQAVNAAGLVTRATNSFTSQPLTLDQQTYPSVTPLEGQVMGIGMPVIVHFDIPVTNRAEFQRYMHVTAVPAQVGTWHWVSSTEVHWRPKVYWQAGTKVTVNLDLNGVDAGNGIYGQMNRLIHFSIGRAVLVKASIASDHMQVFVDGKLARTIPITAGQAPTYVTRSGNKLISEKYASIDMNSGTVGIDPNSPDGYNIPNVQWAMRVTNSGEFLHAAPWSVYAQGKYNVSHGCMGMSTENAHWLFDLAEIGTPVQVTGSSRPLEQGNGWTDWNETWAQYQAASALN